MRCARFDWRCLVVALLTAWTATVGAQDYPVRLIRLVVPFPPAGATDIYSRLSGPW